MNFKCTAVALSVAMLAGCQSYTIKTEPAQGPTKGASAYQDVEVVSDLMIQVAPGSLEQTLVNIANQAGLELRYAAEPFLHQRSGSLKGSAAEIAQQVVAGFPMRVFVAGNTLVAEQMWTASAGTELKSQLEGWDSKSQWKVVWSTRNNMHIEATAYFFGTFDSAVEQLFKSVRNDGSELEPEFYPNYTVVIR